MNVQSIRLADLRPPAHNPRRVTADDALDELAASIRSDGLLQNLVVAPCPSVPATRHNGGVGNRSAGDIVESLTHFETLTIQMRAVVPLLRDLMEILGEDTVRAALEERNRRRLAETEPAHEPDFSRMAQGTRTFAAGGALEYEIIASSNERFDLDVRRCRYAELMETLGARDVGHLLICAGDFPAAKKIGMQLTRTGARMQGAPRCDFRYRPLASPTSKA